MRIARWALALVLSGTAAGQVYSPQVLRHDQIDASTLRSFAKGICDKAGAKTERERAEAIWRFLLADGRFVKPGFWYHLDGWAYEEPRGLTLDPLKLLHSYGFGSAAQSATVLEAVWHAAGFVDARVWLLNGYTVAEVFYDGAYHYFDADLMGYTTTGKPPFRQAPVASVRQIERDPSILLRKLKTPNEADWDAVDYPWYPLDLRQGTIENLARIFSAKENHWLFPYQHAPEAHHMEFVLRPGERLIRNFRPESRLLFYLPFANDGRRLTEFPNDSAAAHTADGPGSRTDDRAWATGQIEYSPPLSNIASFYPSFGAGFNENLRLPRAGSSAGLSRLHAPGQGRAVFEVNSPYVIIDGRIALEAKLSDHGETIAVETSIDGGRTWDNANSLTGPYRGKWEARIGVRARGPHGALSAVGGTYGYLVRLTLSGPGGPESVVLENVTIVTRFQLNPRTLPEIAAGRNEMIYRPGIQERWRPIPLRLDMINRAATRTSNVRYIAEEGQGRLAPSGPRSAELIVELSVPEGARFSGFEAGGRFLDVREGVAPDKSAPQIRLLKERAMSARAAATLAWSTAPDGEYKTLWTYEEEPKWRDGDRVQRLLRWPEVDVKVDALPAGARKVYVRYRFEAMSLDNPRLAVRFRAPLHQSALEITHLWREDGQARRHVERIDDPTAERRYFAETGNTHSVTNESVILYCPPAR